MTCTPVLLDSYSGHMKVSEKEASAMLYRLERAVEEIEDAERRRNQLIKEAMEAGVPRQKIADAAGMTRVNLYNIARD